MLTRILAWVGDVLAKAREKREVEHARQQVSQLYLELGRCIYNAIDTNTGDIKSDGGWEYRAAFDRALDKKRLLTGWKLPCAACPASAPEITAKADAPEKPDWILGPGWKIRQYESCQHETPTRERKRVARAPKKRRK